MATYKAPNLPGWTAPSLSHPEWTDIQKYNHDNESWAQFQDQSAYDPFKNYSVGQDGISTAALMDPNVRAFFNEEYQGGSIPQKIQEKINHMEDLYKSQGWDGVQKFAKDYEVNVGREGAAMSDAHPEKKFSDGSFETSDFLVPLAMGTAIFGGGALASGLLAGGGGAAAGAAAGTGGLGSLGSTWAALPSAAQSALTSMGVKGAMNVVTGQPFTSGLLQAGLTAGLGNIGSNFIGPYVGEGLSSLGFSPETVAGLVKPVTTGIVGTGAGLIRGQNLGNALLNGMQSGTISYAGDKLNGFLGNSGLNKPMQDIVGGAGKGAIGSVIRGKNPLSGIVGGATQGAFNYGAGMIGDISKPEVSTPSKGIMSGESDDDYFSLDGTDWLSKIENDYSDPYNFRSDDFYNYGNDNYEPYTMNDSYSDAFPDLYNYQADAPDTGNSALDNFLKQLGGGVGGALGNAVGGGSGGSSNSFIDKLMKQIGGIGDKAGQNPLAAIAAALGAAGTVRNAFGGAPNNLGMVDALMAKGAQQMNTPAVLPRGNITARDPRLFVQNYAADSTPISNAPQGPDYHSQLNTLYQSVLGRAPDAAGEQYWIHQMQNGVSLPQVLQYLNQSAEKNPQAGAVMTGGLGQI